MSEECVRLYVDKGVWHLKKEHLTYTHCGRVPVAVDGFGDRIWGDRRLCPQEPLCRQCVASVLRPREYRDD